MDYGFSLAMEYSAELTLLHVLENSTSATDLQIANREAMQSLEEPVPQGSQNSCTITCVVRTGKSYEEIIQLALEAQSDLVILGVRGRSTLNLALPKRPTAAGNIFTLQDEWAKLAFVRIA